MVSDQLHSAPKIFKETCQINWQDTSYNINNFVRGLNPYPTAWTIIDGKTCKIFSIKAFEIMGDAVSGSFITDHKEKLYAKCADAWVSVEDLQMEGKKRMKIEDFLRGNPLSNLPTIE